eukprot:c930_g1_i1.p1 GENE.c930_g1_i1~~c930_g1_i1.p1  ORF type:complete len:164 (-),score=47.56 c930_g1_i1:26-517(-)
MSFVVLLLAFSHPIRQRQLGVVTTVRSNNCARVTKPHDSILMNYEGHLNTIDGKVFDSSFSRNEPFEFTLGIGQVIQGWDEGLVGMCQGEERILTIPPEMGYGDHDMGDIPAGSTLVFKTQLVGWDDTPSLASRFFTMASTMEETAASKLQQLTSYLLNAQRY